MKRALLIGFQFPPLVGTSGVQRMLRFAEHLPAYGWKPYVLTASAGAMPQTDPRTLHDIPEGVTVVRSFALDAARHLAIGGRYWRRLAIPDRWASWIPFAVRDACRLIDREAIDAVWTTYPIASAHRIGNWVHRLRGRPWIADFRDPMAQDDYPSDPLLWRSFERIEREAARRAAFLTFTSPGARDLYARRYGASFDDARFTLLMNGYDEGSFAGIEVTPPPARAPSNDAPLVLLHSGVVYPSERDPTQLFAALASLRARGAVSRRTLRLRFRASSHDAMLQELAARHAVGDLIELLPPIGYRDALAEMREADGLLVLQAANCNGQIPAKLYEYLRAQRPILALADPAGDTGRLVASLGSPHVAALEDAQAIESALADFLDAIRRGAGFVVAGERVAAFSRGRLTGELARLLDAATTGEAVTQPASAMRGSAVRAGRNASASGPTE
ncbi:MAG: glycosyltransferase [Burkholderiaceae bacterium]|nr:glycosyltransferase [Burkholderiaceae bacterium]